MDTACAAETVSSDSARQLRLCAQGLTWPAADARPAVIVAALCGVQAQDMPGARLSLWARAEDLRPRSVDQAIRDRQVVRTWAMRGTLHLLAAPDVRWVLAVLAPALTKLSARQTQLGLDQQTFGRALAILREALHEGQERTRAELGAALRAHGVAPDGQRLPHILGYMSVRGVLCQGPPRGAEPTYVLLDDWLPPDPPSPSLDRVDALGQLARRYLAAHGPADLHDFAWWSGLPLSDARTAWDLVQPEVVTITTAGKHYALLASERDRWSTTSTRMSRPSAHLLPGFDSYVLGYKDRRLTLDPAYVKRVNAGGGMLKPTVVVDGRVVGVWNRAIGRHRLDVTVTPFERLAADVETAIKTEAARLGGFLEREIELTVTDPE